MSEQEEITNVNKKYRSSKRERIKHSLQAMLSTLDVGQKIPTERNLSKELSASRRTIRTVLDEFESSRIIKKEQGSGTFLVRPIAEYNKTSDKSVKIGVALPCCENPMIRDIDKGISAASKESGFITIKPDIATEAKAEIKCLYEMSERPLNGLIIYPLDMIVYEQEFIDFIEQQTKRGLSVVLVDRYLPFIDTCFVIPDYFQAAYILTRHLIMLGHREILNLSMAKTGGTTGVTCLRGYKKALRDYNISYREELVVEREDDVNNWAENAYHILKEFLGRNSQLPFTAIYCDHEGYVYGAYRALREHGLKVPEDIPIVSKDECNSPYYKEYSTAVDWTFTETPWEEIGRKAVELIKLQHSGSHHQGGHQPHVILPPKLVIRKSCGIHLGRSGTQQNSYGPARILSVLGSVSKQPASEPISETKT